MKKATTQKENRLPQFEIFFKKNDHSAGYIRALQPPYLIGKVIKIRNQYKALDFALKPVQFCKEKVFDFNIFIIQNGFDKKPKNHVSDEIITACLKRMAVFYYQEKILHNKIVNKTYKTVDPALL